MDLCAKLLQSYFNFRDFCYISPVIFLKPIIVTGKCGNLI